MKKIERPKFKTAKDTKEYVKRLYAKAIVTKKQKEVSK